jgi:ADP-heptose:LPS heptosyltransferase
MLNELTKAAAIVPAVQENILIVKLGAFGNIVLSMAAFAAIRRHHANARISVLTGAVYADWLRTFPYFDEILVDPRPSVVGGPSKRRLKDMLIAGAFSRVYDLQTSGRSSRYFALFPAKHRPDWSGIAFGCSLPDRDPNRNHIHDTVRIEGQLRQAGIIDIRPPDLSWLKGDIARFNLPPSFALLVPGSSPKRLLKRWPIESYAALASNLRAQGIIPVVLGSAQELTLAQQIPDIIDLTGKTNFGDLADLARAGRFAVGNDTGPMHLLASAGCPSLTLFSRDSNPALCAPVGPWTRVLQRPDLADLPVSAVLNVLSEIPDQP